MQKMCYTNCKLYDSMRKREENSMVTAVRSLGLQGISGYEVTVECFLSGGLPAFDIVGLGDTAVKESRERVRAAVKNCGVKFPVSRITVNLAPAGRKKEGTLYDLPILLGILASAEEIKPPAKDAAFVGELSLTGTLRAVNGVLPMAMAAVRAGIRTLYVPAANAAEATLADGVTVYGVPDVVSLVQHLKGEKKLSPQPKWQAEQTSETGPDFSDAEMFLKEWQKVVSERLTESDREKAEKSKILRLQEFEQLRQDDVRIHVGDLAGQRLVDVLVSDLMETAA